jgi:hypothetical protein
MRLRLVMKPSTTNPSGSVRSTVGVACFSLWLIHPIAIPTTLVADVEVVQQTVLAEPILATRHIESPEPIPGLDIPEAPLGFWNQRPPRQQGALYLWTDRGRPQVLCSIFTYVHAEQVHCKHEAISLAEEPLVAKLDKTTVWSPQQSGVQWRSAESPAPAESQPLFWFSVKWSEG